MSSFLATLEFTLQHEADDKKFTLLTVKNLHSISQDIMSVVKGGHAVDWNSENAFPERLFLDKRRYM